MKLFLSKSLISQSFLNFRTTNNRYFSQLSDEELHKSYKGFWPRMKVPWSDGKKCYTTCNELIQNRISPNDLTAAGVLYVDLQNPLLKRYNFDAKEYLQI